MLRPFPMTKLSHLSFPSSSDHNLSHHSDISHILKKKGNNIPNLLLVTPQSSDCPVPQLQVHHQLLPQLGYKDHMDDHLLLPFCLFIDLVE
jgi:hypothetical protein